jgi:hypothetical protein
MFVVLDQTFAAFAHVSRPYIQETIEKGPPTLETVNAGLPKINPFLHDTARFFTALRPGAKALEETSPIIAESLHAGIPALNASPVINNQLLPTAEALLAFQQSEGVFTGLDLLTDLNKNLKEPLEYIVPAQTKCYYGTLLFSNLSSSNSQGNEYGKWLNFISFEPPKGPNTEAGQASAPANGPKSNHLHYNPLPRTAAPGQEGVCEAGNAKYVAGRTVIGQTELLGKDTREFAKAKAPTKEKGPVEQE